MNDVERTGRLWRALLGGALLTLVTALVPVRTLLGATHYGLPMAWLARLVLAPGYVPWRVLWVGLLVDLVVWTAVVYVLLVLSARVRQRSLSATR